MQALQDHQNISALLIQYGCALDTRDWSALTQVFTPNAQVSYGSLGVFDGQAAIVEVAHAFIESCGEYQDQLVRSDRSLVIQHGHGDIGAPLKGTA